MRSSACILLIPLLVLCACAPATSNTESVSAPRQIRIEGAGTVNLNTTTSAHVARLDFPVPLVWKALPAAFETMGVPITFVDSAHYVLRNDGLKVRRQLADTPLGVFFDCGTTQVGENADSYDVHMTVSVEVQPEPATGNSRLLILLESAARPVSFSRDYSRCSTRGKFEQRFADAVKKQLK
ncbi:MAG: hypothetical protein JWM95_1300 [Gemmatimonadetes bacterium]|nr:hypothetical protein [Gemmatimonadota bacterium]